MRENSGDSLILVVGAGIAGLSLGYLLGERGFDVLVIDKKREIGKPVRDTGLVSERLIELLPELDEEEVVINIFNRAIFEFKNNSFRVTSKKRMFLLDRVKFDRILASLALSTGVKIKLNTKFLGIKDDVALTSKGKEKFDFLVGADGTFSSVARFKGIEQTREFVIGMESTCKGDFDDSYVKLIFDTAYSKSFFGWVVPENKNIARVGLMDHSLKTKTFLRFFSATIGKKPKNFYSDAIRVGLIRSSVAEKCLLVGEAASQVKPFSLGGINYGIIGAKIAAEAIELAFEKDDFSKQFLFKVYDERWKKVLRLAFLKGKLLRKFFILAKSHNSIVEFIKLFRINHMASLLDPDLL